jgi:Protein of unknown function (DUF1571)
MRPFLPEHAVEPPAGIQEGADFRESANRNDSSASRILGQKNIPAPKTWLAQASSDFRARIERASARLPFTHSAKPVVADAADQSRNQDQSKGKETAPPVQIALQAPTALAPRVSNRVGSTSTPKSAPVRRPSAAPAPVAQPPKDPAQIQAEKARKTMETLVASTRARLDSIGNYQLHLTRQERVGSALQPAEDVMLSVRRQPQAIRLEWTEGPHKGREVLYAADRDNGLMHVNMADSLIPMPRLSMRPDSPMALAQSRHPITEAGFDTIVARLESALVQTPAGDQTAGTLTYLGLETIPECAHQCHKIQQSKTGGETWLVYIDSQTRLPAQVKATSTNGDLLELYVFRDVRTELAELASADAFDAEKRWGQPSTLARRLARASTSGSQTDIAQPR